MALTPKQFKQMQEYLVAPKKKRTFAPLVPNLEKMIDLYDGPVIVDGDEIKFENQKRAEPWEPCGDICRKVAKKCNGCSEADSRQCERHCNCRFKPPKEKPKVASCPIVKPGMVLRDIGNRR